MKLSVSVTGYSWPEREIAPRLAQLAGFLDGTAVDTLWVADHLLQADPSSRPDEPMLEAYTVLGYLASVTSRLRLGTMVTAATFRAPALLIKAVTTLDVLSGGRAWLGIGAGYHTDEATAMGLSMPETAERFARMTELLELARRMWAGDDRPFHGDFLTLEHPIASPRPVTSPRPPGLDRWYRRTADAAAGRRVRRRVQPLRHPRRRRNGAPSARGVGPSLCGRRQARRRSGEDHQHRTAARRIGRRVDRTVPRARRCRDATCRGHRSGPALLHRRSRGACHGRGCARRKRLT